jgi:hypothetical protein
MYANTTPNFRFAQRFGVEAEKPALAILQRIATGISLISLTVGFLFLGILITLHRDQADLSGISGGSAVAMAGGICAILVSTVFLVTAYLYLWFSVRCPMAFPVRRETAHLTFSRNDPALTTALLS